MPNIDIQKAENELRNIIAEITEVDPAKITPEASFVEDLEMDSMMALEILAAIEKKYKIQIPEQNLTKITNLKQTLELLVSYLGK